MLRRLGGSGRTCPSTAKLRPIGWPGVGYGSCPTISTRTSFNGRWKARKMWSPAGRYARPAAISARRNCPIAATRSSTGPNSLAQSGATSPLSTRPARAPMVARVAGSVGIPGRPGIPDVRGRCNDAKAAGTTPQLGRTLDRMARPKRATVQQVHDLALSMPGVTVESAGTNPVYQVGRKSFIFFRNPRPDAYDPETGERYDDVIVFWVAEDTDKQALVEDDGTPFFTTPHFKGHRSVLLRGSRVGELTADELAEVVYDAWLARAGVRAREKWLAERGLDA